MGKGDERFERIRSFRASIDSLQKADWLTYEQFAVAFNMSEKTVLNWASKGLLPIVYLNPKSKSMPVVDMNKYRDVLNMQSVSVVFDKMSKEINSENDARKLVEDSLRKVI